MIPAYLSSTMLARMMPISVVWPEGQELKPLQPFLKVEDVRQHRAREDKRGQVDKADRSEDQRQNGERQPDVRIIEINKLYEKRAIKQDRFWVGQAQQQVQGLQDTFPDADLISGAAHFKR